MTRKEDTYSHEGWLKSDHFVKRAFAVFGYNLAASVMMYVGMLFILFTIGFILGVFGLI